MNYLPIAILAYFLNSIAVTIDKFLLTKAIPDPLIYIFYFSLMSLLAIFAIPFVAPPTLFVFSLASLSAIFWTIAAYLMFKALKAGSVQRVIPVIGVLTSVSLLFLEAQTSGINNPQILAIVVLVLGLIFLTIHDWKGKFEKIEIKLEFFSALFFALSYFLLHKAFEQGNFLTVLVWSRPIIFPVVIAFLIIPSLRRKVLPYFQVKSSVINKTSLLFGFGQIIAGISELLLSISISLISPAIVNSIQGIKYIFLLAFGILLGKKYPLVFLNNFSKKFLISQIAGISFIALGLYLLTTN